GYLVPFDGSFEPSEFATYNVSMRQLRDEFLRVIPAKHILVIVDACYSGLLKIQSRGEAPPADVAWHAQRPGHYVLSAGSAGQQVLDGGGEGRSIFAGALIDELNSEEEFLLASQLQINLRRRVSTAARDQFGREQTPDGGLLFGEGEFVFGDSGSVVSGGTAGLTVVRRTSTTRKQPSALPIGIGLLASGGGLAAAGFGLHGGAFNTAWAADGSPAVGTEAEWNKLRQQNLGGLALGIAGSVTAGAGLVVALVAAANGRPLAAVPVLHVGPEGAVIGVQGGF
ncbi:MAG: caspase family protein, partial [Deltaproteobacteria bacterium]|nr:caspase family protein [Deltaproteobacteria bacterium]